MRKVGAERTSIGTIISSAEQYQYVAGVSRDTIKSPVPVAVGYDNDTANGVERVVSDEPVEWTAAMRLVPELLEMLN